MMYLAKVTLDELHDHGATNIHLLEANTAAGPATLILADIPGHGASYGFVQYFHDVPRLYQILDLDAQFTSFEALRMAFENHVEAEADRQLERRNSL